MTFTRMSDRLPLPVSSTPGFLINRINLPSNLEAMRMVEEGVASPQDIDRAMELGYRHPMGPLKLTDLVGLDVRLGIARYLYALPTQWVEYDGSEFVRLPVLPIWATTSPRLTFSPRLPGV